MSTRAASTRGVRPCSETTTIDQSSSCDLNRVFHVNIFESTGMGAVRDAICEDQPDSDHASYRVLRQLNFRVRLIPDPAAAFFPPITPFPHCA